MKKANQDIRMMLEKSGVRQWELADAAGFSANYFVMKLRKELPESEKLRMYALIQQIADRKEAES